uniref:Uncharacterized protein n=1 Tax=Plectus sambesii TaxID=2011161 RepID=A0A914W5C3_9BILA
MVVQKVAFYDDKHDHDAVRNRQHCLFSRCHVVTGTSIFLTIYLIGTFLKALFFLLFFLHGLFLLVLPAAVVICTYFGIKTENHKYFWPFIAISIFHIIISIAAGAMFTYIAIFLPKYLLMVLNLVRGRMDQDVNDGYIVCSVLFLSFLVIFSLYNYWQLRVVLSCKKYYKAKSELVSFSNSTSEPQALNVNYLLNDDMGKRPTM